MHLWFYLSDITCWPVHNIGEGNIENQILKVNFSKVFKSFLFGFPS